MSSDQAHRDEQANKFAQELLETVHATLATDSIDLMMDVNDLRYALRTPPTGFTLTLGGRPVGSLHFNFNLSLDHARLFLKVLGSSFTISSEVSRTPLVRLDFRGDASTEPISHWQVHAESGPVSSWLTRARPDSPQPRRDFGLDRLWLPTGGERYRPCLEDVLELLIVSLGVDSRDGWRTAVQEGRQRWREYQFCAVVRDDPELAAKVLTRLGYKVIPTQAPRPRRLGPFRNW